ncbi:MAG: methyltransferase domain-containing protein [Rhizomicrobium sp.]|jgi:SAM-dependent methyltransferase
MLFDSRELVAFYDEPLGQITRRMIGRRVRIAWPDVRSLRILGYGFAMPYLRPFLSEAERIAAVLPVQDSSLTWPGEKQSIAFAEEDALPFPDAMFDRIMIVHGLETAESVRPLLRQVWRVLTSGGRLLLIVPNRASLWAQVELSPFAQGRPYSRKQLDRLMRDCMFLPERWDSALFLPPIRTRRFMRSGVAWERIGRSVWPRLAGVHLLEASKSLYALPPPERAVLRRAVLAPAAR